MGPQEAPFGGLIGVSCGANGNGFALIDFAQLTF
jgi:hypothetical protein